MDLDKSILWCLSNMLLSCEVELLDEFIDDDDIWEYITACAQDSQEIIMNEVLMLFQHLFLNASLETLCKVVYSRSILIILSTYIAYK